MEASFEGSLPTLDHDVYFQTVTYGYGTVTFSSFATKLKEDSGADGAGNIQELIL